MTGFDPTLLPPLAGYDFAEAKPDAQVVLVSHRNDPVLAKWQYGLGRVVAWTSDDGADLADQWTSCDRYGEFWVGVLRWTLPDPERSAVSVVVARDGPDLVLSLTTGSDPSASDYVDLTGLTAQISDLQGTLAERVHLDQSGSGEYQIRIQAGDPGAYELQLTDSNGKPTGNPLGFVLPASPELLPSAGGQALMQSIASTTGGSVLSLDNPGAAFSHATSGAPAVRIYRAIWSWFGIAALLLFMLDLMIRLHGWDRLRALRPARVR
jgi:hypothetical protein